MTAAIRAGLLAVSARAHRAPGAGLVPRVVDERPLAVFGATGLEPAPRALGHCRVDGRDDTPEGACDPRRCGEQARGSCREAKLYAPATRRLVQHRPRTGGVDLDVVVFEQETAESLAEVDRSPKVGRSGPFCSEKLVRAQPPAQVGRARELLLVAGRVLVERIDEVANELVARNY